MLVHGVLEGGCAFVVPCEGSATLSWDEEVIIVRGSAKWHIGVASCYCLVVLGVSVKEIIKVMMAAFLDELSVHATARVVHRADAQLVGLFPGSLKCSFMPMKQGRSATTPLRSGL